MSLTIGQLFNIEYGQKEYHNKEWLEGNEGENILISSKGVDNGLYGFFDIPTKYKAPIITVQGYGTIGQAFVQEYNCSVDDHMLILSPKKKMTFEDLFQVAHQIRLTKWKYRYGRGITKSRLENQKIKLPHSKLNYQKFMQEILPEETKIRKSLRNLKLKQYELGDIFQIYKGKGEYFESLDLGKTPLVSATNEDNGIVGLVNLEPSFKAPAITVERIKCKAFVQLKDFATVPDDIFVLVPKYDFQTELLFFISAQITKSSWKFNYCRKVTKERLGRTKIALPLNFEKNTSGITELANNCYGYKELEASSV